MVCVAFEGCIHSHDMQQMEVYPGYPVSGEDNRHILEYVLGIAKQQNF